MKTIPTAEEFFNKEADKLKSAKEDMPQWMIEKSIEFAKLHVEQALKEASEKATMKVEYPDEAYQESNEISILTEQKQMFSREEVTELLRLAWATASAYGENTNEADCIDWINHNLH